jgi:hypothetical protein
MSKHFYHRAEASSFYGDTSPGQESLPYGTAAGGYNAAGRSYYESDSNVGACYMGAGYGDSAGLPPGGFATSPYFHPVEQAPGTSFQPATMHHSTIYRNSSNVSDAPGLSTSASSESTMSMDRPAPAKSAFMCFSEAKRSEILRMVGPEGMVRCVFLSHICVLCCGWHQSVSVGWSCKGCG